MTDTNNENLDSSNEEEAVEASEDKSTTDNNQGDEMSDREKQLLARAKKAEGKLKDLKGNVEEPADEPVKAKPNEPDYSNDYGLQALLEQRGHKHPDDKKLILDEATRLKMSPLEVSEMAHIKAGLKDAKSQREAEAGQPKGGSRGSDKVANDVDHHIKKGTTPDDLELAEQVINKRMGVEKKSNEFADDLFTG